MENKIINVSRKEIQETTAFKTLSKILQSITLKKQNVSAIKNAVNISLNRGFGYWEKQTQSRNSNVKIVKEIVNNKNK